MAKLAIFNGVNAPFEVKDYPLAAPKAGMAGIRLVASGICGTDVHIYTGRIPAAAPMNMGHEFIGTIDQINCEDAEKTGLSVGDNVIVDIAVPCGKCPLCLSGDDANCVNMGVTNGGNPLESPHFFGGYGEYNYTQVQNLVKIPASLEPEMTAVFACAGPTALHAFSLMEKSNRALKDVKTAVVQGLGPVGMFAAMYLKAMGVQHVAVITTGKNIRRDELAKSFGADEVWRLNEMDDAALIKRAKEINGGLGADLVYEASGSIKAVPLGLQLLRNRGVYLIPGQYSNSGEAAISPQLITFNALQLIGSSQYSMADVEHYIRFLTEHPELHKKIKSLIARYPVIGVNRAFEDVMAGRCVKALLTLENE